MPENGDQEREEMNQDGERVINAEIREQADLDSGRPSAESPKEDSHGSMGSDPDDPLIADLESADGSVRKSAAAALGKIGNHKAVRPLIRALKDESRDVRTAAAAALGKIGDHQAVKPLIGLLKDVHRDVRTSAEEALTLLIEDTAAEEGDPEEMVCPFISSGFKLVFCRGGRITRAVYIGTESRTDTVGDGGEIPYTCAAWNDGKGCSRL